MNGNVGIGTWSPVGSLEVRGTTATRIWTGAGTSTNATTAGELYVEGDLEVDGTIYGDGSGLTGVSGLTVAGGWSDGGPNVYTTTTTDNVGIGTTTPNAATLEIVKNAAQPLMKLSSNVTGSGDFLIVDSAGNVGIGTQLAQAKLHVSNVSLPLNTYLGTYLRTSDAGRTAGGGSYRGMLISTSHDSAAFSSGSVSGMEVAAFSSSPTDLDELSGISIDVMHNGDGNVTQNLLGLYMFLANTGSGNINGDMYGIYIDKSGNPLGTSYGLFLEAMNGYGIYSSGATDRSYFAGNVGIGTFNTTGGKLIVTGGNVGVGTVSAGVALLSVNGETYIAGPVGIGTFTPTGMLDVRQDEARIWTGAGTSTNATAAGELYVEGDLEVDGTIYGDGSGITALPSGLPAGGWTDGGTNVYTTTTTDNVGIGTTMPTATLLVENAGTQESFRVNDAAADSTPFIIDASGNVGIGTTTSGGKLSFGTNPGDAVRLYDGLAASRHGIGIQSSETQFYVPTTAHFSFNRGGDLQASGTNELLRIDGSGNVGIGTTTPAGALTVMNGNVGIGTWSPRELLELNSGSIYLGSSSGPSPTTNRLYSLAGNLFWNGTQLDTGAIASGWTDGGPVIYQVTTSDLVGIGTTTPSTTLEIVRQGANAPVMVSRTSAGDGDLFLITSDGNTGIGTTTPVAGLAVMSGNVGIGTWSPTQRLQVVGTVSSTALAAGSASQFQVSSAGAITATTGITTSGGYAQSGTDANTLTGTTTFSDATTAAIFSTGNVGVGTTSATVALLNVNGETYLAGPVGMGTFTPTGMLDVRQDEVRIWTGAGTSTNATTAGELYVEGDLEVDGTIYGDGSGITALPATLPAGGWTDGGTNVYTTTTTDLVAIGTTTPASKLTLAGNMSLGTTLPYRTIAASTDGMTVEGNVGIGTWTANSGKLIVMGGNVGINDNAPSSRLAVIDINTSTASKVAQGNDMTVSPSGAQASTVNNRVLYLTQSGQSANDMGRLIGIEAEVAQNSGNGVTAEIIGGKFWSQKNTGGAVTTMNGLETLIGANAGGSVADMAGVTIYNEVGSGTVTNQYGVRIRDIARTGGSVANRYGLYMGAFTGAVTATDFGIYQAGSSQGNYFAGNIGIGTFTPTGMLDVRQDEVRIWTGAGTSTNATAAGELYVEGDLEVDGTIYGDGSGITALPAALPAGGWSDGGSNVYTTSTTDNVGIGTTTPSAMLLVENVGSQDSLRINDGLLDASPFIVTADGNVGIGTTTPVTKVHIEGTNHWPLALRSPSATGTLLNYRNSNNGIEWNLGQMGTGWAGAPDGSFVIDQSSSGPKVVITPNSGNVGIGTTVPRSALSVLSGNVGIGTTDAANAFAVGPTSQFQVDAAGAIAATTGITTSGGYTQSGTGTNTLTGTTTFSNATTAAIFSTGNVGIGTTSATVALLNVNGETYLAGPVGMGTFTPTGMLDVRQDEMRIWTGAGTSTNATTAGELYVEGDLEVDGTIYGDGSGITALPTGLPAGGWTDGGTNVYTSTTTDNVGIGTTTPNAATLEVVKNAAQSPFKISSSATGGGDYMFVSSSGNVGISTTNPTEVLRVNGNIQTEGYLSLADGTPTFPSVTFISSIGTGLYRPAIRELGIVTFGAERMRIDSQGNVGIGTQTPGSKLVISGGVAVGSGQAYTTLAAPTDGLMVQGNVGVGTTSATVALLNVNGETYIAGPVGIGTFTPTGMMDIRQDEVRIWTGAGTDTNALAAGELYVEGDLEVDGTIYGDGSGITSLPATLPAGGWTDGGTNVYTSATTDNVGIGTTTPTAALLVENTGTQTSFRVNDALLDSSPFIIDPSGNVGIGTITTDSVLVIKRDLASTVYMSIENMIADPSAQTQLRLLGASTTPVGVYFGDDGSFSAGSIIYSNSTDSMAFATNAGTRMTINSSGNVGVGTITPVGALTVMNGNVGIGTWSPRAKLEVVGSVLATSFVGDGSGLTNLPGGSSGWTDGGTNVYTTTTTDNVGIGTTTPTSTVEIVKTAAGTSPLMVSTTATADGDLLVVHSGGNVGIGTASPEAKLTVVTTGQGLFKLYDSGNDAYLTIGDQSKSSTGEQTLIFRNTQTGANGWFTGIGDDEKYYLAYGSAAAPPELNESTSAMSISQTSGNLGVGGFGFGVDPASKLTVVGNASIGSGGAYTAIAAPADGLIVQGSVGIGTHAPTQGAFIVSTGNVGIGTVTPVAGTAIMNGNAGIGTWSPRAKLEVIGSVLATSFMGDGSGLTNVANTSGWTDGGTNVYTSTTTDNVGIGTTTPNAATLEIVKNAAQPALKVSSTATASGDYLIVNSAGNVGIGTNTPSGALAVMNGNVGIGTVSPPQRLYVNGVVLATTAFDLGHEIISNTSASNSVNKSVTATCTAGKLILGGGCNITDSSTDLMAMGYPNSTTTYICEGREGDAVATNWTVTAYAICGRVQ